MRSFVTEIQVRGLQHSAKPVCLRSSPLKRETRSLVQWSDLNHAGERLVRGGK